MTWCPRCQRAVASDRYEERSGAETVTVVLRCRICGATLAMADKPKTEHQRPKAPGRPVGGTAR